MKEQMLKLNGWNVRVVTDLKGGVPILLINGFGAQLESFDPLVKSLGKDVSTIRFDIPGVAGTVAPILPYRFKSVAKRLHLLLEILGVDKVDVLGYSWGGGVAQEFAHHYPKQCRKLFLAGTSMGGMMLPPKLTSGWGKIKSFICPMKRSGLKNAQSIYGGKIKDLKKIFATMGETARISRNYSQFFPLFGWTSMHWAWKLKMPILLMAGLDDQLARVENMMLMNCVMRKSKLALFDCGHLFMLTKADEAAKSIIDFRS